MNMQNLMAQAQKMQKEIMAKKEEINQKEFLEKNEYVEIAITGDKKLKRIKINPDTSSDLEALEDMIAIAYNNAISKIDKEMEKALGAYGSLNGLI